MINDVLGDDPLLRPSVTSEAEVDVSKSSGGTSLSRRTVKSCFFFLFFRDLMEEKKNEKSMISKEEHNLYEPRTNTRLPAHFRITYFR